MFCGPTEGPLAIACELPMLLTSWTNECEKPLTRRISAARTQQSQYPVFRRRIASLPGG